MSKLKIINDFISPKVDDLKQALSAAKEVRNILQNFQ